MGRQAVADPVEALSQAPAVIWATDPELRFTFGVGAALEGLIDPPADLRGTSLFELFETHDPGFEPIAMNLRALSGEPVAYRTTWRGRRWFVQVRPLRGDDGQVVGTIGVALDTREQRATEEALHASEQRLRLVLEQLPINVWSTDADLRLNFASGALFRELAERRNGSEVLAVEQLMADDARHPSLAAHQRALEGATVVYETTGPRSYLCYVEPMRDADGAVSGVVGAAMDISERKRAEQALAESEARFRAIFERAGIGMGQVDLQGRLLEPNAAMCQLLGYSAAQLRGRRMTGLVHPEDLQPEEHGFADLVAGRRQRFQMVKSFVRSDKRQVLVRQTSSLVRDSAGAPSFVIVMAEPLVGQEVSTPPVERELTLQLTEARVLELVALGKSTRDVAAEMHLSNQAITYHIGNLLGKFQAANRAGMVARAYALGVLNARTWPPSVRTAGRPPAG